MSDRLRTYRIAALPGDGIGREVVPAAITVLDAAARMFGFELVWKEYPWSCEYYEQHGRMMPPDGLEMLREHHAVYLGAVGWPGVPDHVSLWGLLIPIRRGFQQCVNLRPIRVLSGVPSPLRDADNRIDFVVIRENNEGEYSEIGGRLHSGTDLEMAIQASVFTRVGTEQVMRFAFDLARERGGRIASATKSNGIMHTMPFWDQLFDEIGESYPDVERVQYHIDALAGLFVLDPRRFGVIVASNLFGDILTDLGSAITGSIGIAPSANLNPSRELPSMFEPIHGSAPDIAGQDIANPVGQVWAGALMLEHLGESEASAAVVAAMEASLMTTSTRTRDLRGTATTTEAAAAIVDLLEGGGGAAAAV